MHSGLRLTAALGIALPILAVAADGWKGQKLADYLDSLNEQGQRIIFSSDLVTGDMQLDEEPDAGEPTAGLDELLQPFGLTTAPGPANSLLIVELESPATISPAAPANLRDIAIPEIVVTSSLHRLEYSSPTTHSYLDRDLVTRIPTLDEAIRVTDRLPGTASGGLSSRNHVRGGEVNEVLFLFDGLRLYEPYHLKDFQSIATIVNANAIGGMDFYTGAFPAHFGDRMSGVLSIDMREPTEPLETELALSFLNASILSMGTFGSQRQGEWLASARRSNLDLIFDVIDPQLGDPDYQDYFAHLRYAFGPRTDLSVNFLVSEDKLTLVDNDRGEFATAAYSNRVLWLKWTADWTDRLRSESIFALSDISNRRQGSVDLPQIVSGTLNDSGEFDVTEFRQDWTWTAADNWMLRFGVDLKDLDATYRFTSTKRIEAPFDTLFDNQPLSNLDLQLAPAGAQYAAYSELRWRPFAMMTIDLGLRWDQQNYTTAEDDKQYSPRGSILFQANDRTDIRLGWGQYHQAQEINELQISDGVTGYFPAQRAEHFVFNVRHGFSARIEASLSLYRKSFRTIRPRFENSYNALTLLPELQFDRIRVDATNAEALGAELTLTRSGSNDESIWWLSYAWSEAEDMTVNGDQPRSWDQTHAVKAGASWRLGPWDFSVAGEWHSGWPISTLAGTVVDMPGGGQALELQASERNAQNLSSFHTLDARISRNFDLPRGELTAFLEITNLYNRANPCCIEYSVAADGSLIARQSHWLPILPSLGVVWAF